MATDYFAHETACIDQPCEIGEGSRIWHFSHIMSGATIGADCNIGQNVYVDLGAVIGDGCKLQNNVSIYKGVILEEGVFCGPSMVFTNVINPRAFIERKHEFRTTLIKKGSTLGANSTILCGVTIGEYALMLGVPAQRAGWVCRCGVALPNASSPVCPECGERYRRDEDGLLQPLS
ncbi:MAG: N-acetyltransferase [Gemmatimonadetes bacterium]|nr:N-acetyltransferase [Gemmatimonadota bacterium]